MLDARLVFSGGFFPNARWLSPGRLDNYILQIHRSRQWEHQPRMTMCLQKDIHRHQKTIRKTSTPGDQFTGIWKINRDLNVCICFMHLDKIFQNRVFELDWSHSEKKSFVFVVWSCLCVGRYAYLTGVRHFFPTPGLVLLFLPPALWWRWSFEQWELRCHRFCPSSVQNWITFFAEVALFSCRSVSFSGTCPCRMPLSGPANTVVDLRDSDDRAKTCCFGV